MGGMSLVASALAIIEIRSSPGTFAFTRWFHRLVK